MDKDEYLLVLKQVGENIRKIRISRNLSQEELAFLIHSARNYVGCIERAEKYPSLITLTKIARALGVKLEDLVRNA